MTSIKAQLALATMATIGKIPLSLSRALGASVARLAWVLNTREIKTTKRNIELCFPSLSAKEQHDLAYKSVLALGRLSFEINWVWYSDPDKVISNCVQVKHPELITDRGSERGVIGIAPHLGNWEVAGLHMSTLGPAAYMFQPPKQAYIEPIMTRARSRLGASMHPTNIKGVAGVMRHLKQGGIAGILPDQNPDQGSGEFAPFYNINTYTMTLIHKLIQKTDCKVVMLYALRCKGGFEMCYAEPPEEIYSSDQATSLAALNRAVEEAVAMAPEQYQWEYKRFKKVPEGEGKRY